MSQLLKKINIGFIILRKDGVMRFLKILNSKIFGENVNFRQVKGIVLNEIDDTEETVRSLVKGVSYVYGMGVEGDVAEFGTATGKSAVALAVAVSRFNRTYESDPRGTKKAWFFDSFEGLPLARFDIDKKSGHVATGIWAEGTCQGLSETQLQQLLKKYLHPQNFNVVKGWFKDTVPLLLGSQKFSLLHIDGDLYESAIDVLDSLFCRGLISNGAMILFDDWNCNAADPAVGERRAWQEVCEKYGIEFSDAGAYGVASHKFIIHNYKSSHASEFLLVNV